MVGDMKETERGESSTFALNKGGKKHNKYKDEQQQLISKWINLGQPCSDPFIYFIIYSLETLWSRVEQFAFLDS